MSDESRVPVRYEERDAIAIITIDRPEKLNTLTEHVVQGVADGIDAATASPNVRAVVLRGEGRVFTAGYDLTGGAESGWSNSYDAPSVPSREGAWDPVRDYQWMRQNVERFMITALRWEALLTSYFVAISSSWLKTPTSAMRRLASSERQPQ